MQQTNQQLQHKTPMIMQKPKTIITKNNNKQLNATKGLPPSPKKHGWDDVQMNKHNKNAW